MTALELADAGVVFTRIMARVVARVPKGRADLGAALKAEVERRVPRLADLAKARSLTAPRGCCETCGDRMRHYLAGMCDLCVAARGKALARTRSTLW